MARPLSPERLNHIAGCAALSFGRLGYKRTRMADVSAAAGLSAGAIYTYVESKEALFHLVFTTLFGHGPPSDGASVALPLATPAQGETVALIAKGMEAAGAAPLLRAALRAEAPGDPRAELRGIVEEQYDTVERLWPAFAVIEACAIDLPELEEMYFRGVRRRRQSAFARYVAARMGAGYFKPMPDPSLAARAVIESVAWFAWHRRGDRDGKDYDDVVARATVVELALSALVGEAP